MIIYSCNTNIRKYEYAVYFDGATFNYVDLPFYASFLTKSSPVRFDNRSIIRIKYKTNDYLKYLREAVEFAISEGIKSIAAGCPRSLTLKDISSLSESLGIDDDKINIRIILHKAHLGKINAENDKKVSDYVKDNYVYKPSIQFSYDKVDIDIPEGDSTIQYSIGSGYNEELEKNSEERKERYRKASDHSAYAKVSLEELKRDLEKEEPRLEKSFSDTLFELIEEHHADEVDVYKKANLDKRLFSKIRNNPDYHPTKATVLSLCIALKLGIEETEILLNTIGASLSMSDMSDVIVKAFILNEIYDLEELNLVLLERNLRPLTYYN